MREAVCIVGHVMLRGAGRRKRPRRSTAPPPPLRGGEGREGGQDDHKGSGTARHRSRSYLSFSVIVRAAWAAASRATGTLNGEQLT